MAWKALTEEERKYWDDMAYLDKARFKVEMESYNGPLTVPKKFRAARDPIAPRRPVSAFLSYSNEKRAEVKLAHPLLGTNEFSAILTKMWKEAPAEERQAYLDRNAARSLAYKEKVAEWKEWENAAREMRERAAVQQAIDSGLCSVISANPTYTTIADEDENETCDEDTTLNDDEDWDPLPFEYVSSIDTKITDNYTVTSAFEERPRRQASVLGTIPQFDCERNFSPVSTKRSYFFQNKEAVWSPTSVNQRQTGPPNAYSRYHAHAAIPYYPYWGHQVNPNQYGCGSPMNAAPASITPSSSYECYDRPHPSAYPSYGREAWP